MDVIGRSTLRFYSRASVLGRFRLRVEATTAKSIIGPHRNVIFKPPLDIRIRSVLTRANSSVQTNVEKSIKKSPFPNGTGTTDETMVGISQNDDNHWRPMTIRERLAKFPDCVNMLYKDWLLYQNINDASRTPRNAWTIRDDPSEFATNAGGVASQTVQSRIPWRQREQQRRFKDSINTVLPIVIMWIAPVVGYIPVVLSFCAPRQLLSRHFINDYEMYHFNTLAYQQRHAHFDGVIKQLLADQEAKLWLDEAAASASNGMQQHDVAGPIPGKLSQLYRSLFSSLHSNDSTFGSIETYSKESLTQFSLAVGVFSSLPPSLANELIKWTPSAWLRRRVKELAVTVSDDDNSLLLQQERSYGEPSTVGNDVVGTLTDLEVMDACLMRGLPVDINAADDMRLCLLNHLDLIASLEEKVADVKDTNSDERSTRKSERVIDREAFGLFTLHLSIIRHYLKKM